MFYRPHEEPLHWAAQAESQVSLHCGQKGSALLQAGETALWFPSQQSSFASGFPSIMSLKPSFSSGSGAISCLEEKDVVMGKGRAWVGQGSTPPCSFIHSVDHFQHPIQKQENRPRGILPIGQGANRPCEPQGPSQPHCWPKLTRAGAEDVGRARYVGGVT